MTHALVEWLLGDTTIRSMVGQNVAGDTWKVYQAIVPQDEKPPYICLRVAGFDVTPCKMEASTEETDTIQVDVYAGSYFETYTLYRVVRQVLDGNEFNASDGTNVFAQISSGRDYTEAEMLEVGKRGVYGIVSLFRCDVRLGSIT